jgi:hypothetical protein
MRARPPTRWTGSEPAIHRLTVLVDTSRHSGDAADREEAIAEEVLLDSVA